MVQKLASNKQLTVDSEVFSVLHELAQIPGTSVGFKKLQRKLSAGINNDVKKLMLYCSQQAYVEYDGNSVQLTDAGLRYYLGQQKVYSRCA